MSASTHTQKLVWSGPAHSTVLATGDFDEWKGTAMLRKNEADGTWTANVDVPQDTDAKDIRYKFVVDGTWQHALDQPHQDDGSGNVNNFFTVPQAQAESQAPSGATASQEAAAEATPTAPLDTAASQAAHEGVPGTTEGTNATREVKEAEPVSEFAATSSSGPVESGTDINATAVSSSEPVKDIPTSLTELLTGASGSGEGGAFSGGEGGSGPFTTYNVGHFDNIAHLDAARAAYPSRYLLQTPEPTDSTVPSDEVLACAYILNKHRLIHEGREAASTNETAHAKEGATANGSVGASEPGILKIMAKVREDNPRWQFSEKRLRKVVRDEQCLAEADRICRLANLVGAGKGRDALVPVSRMDPQLVKELQRVSGQALPQQQAASPARPAAPVLDPEAEKENQLPVPTTNGSSGGKKKSKKPKSSTAPSAAASLTETVSNAASSALTAAQDLASTASSTLTSAISTATSAAPDAAAPAAAPTAPQGDVSLKWVSDLVGRGVVANRPFKRNTVLFREEAFAFAPTRNIQAAVVDGQACGFCGKLLFLSGKSSAVSLVVSCTAHDGLEGPSSAKGASGRKVPTAGKKLTPTTNQRKVSSSAKGRQEQAAEAVKAIDAAAEKDGKKGKCQMKFCNKLCRERCQDIYANLLCPVVNPSYQALLSWAETQDARNGKQNYLGVFRVLLCLIVASQRDGFEKLHEAAPIASNEVNHCGRELLARIECLTAINERKRRQREQGVLADLHFGQDWLNAFRLVYEALQLPDKYYEPLPAEPDAQSKADLTELTKRDGDREDEKKATKPLYPGQTIQRPQSASALPEWLKKDLPQELSDKILGFDNFLVWLGRIALNQEDDGGIYLLHPCLNHSCDANAIVKRTASLNNVGAREAKPSRIYVVALKDIAEGEEITISYVSPDAPVDVRRGVLNGNYLFECRCTKCMRQLAERDEERSKVMKSHQEKMEGSKLELENGADASSERTVLEETA